MRLHFQDQPWDLRFAIAYSLVISGAIFETQMGNSLAILLVLFVPGYVLLAALIPGDKEITWTERLALSVALSIVVISLLGLLLSVSPWGFRFSPITAAIAGFTVLIGVAAYWRRLKLPAETRLSVTVTLAVRPWQERGPMDKALVAAFLASIVVAAGTLAYVVATPRAEEEFTEFFLLGPNRTASGYPTNLVISQPGTVIIGVQNHERRPIDYAIRVDQVGVRLMYNSTLKANETSELNRTTRVWINFSLEDGRTWTRSFTFTIDTPGLWKMEFLLYADSDQTNQRLGFLVRVT